ncbi:MAG: c-type cytochrome domain-containing protein [Planctomycetota bacterium]
MAALLRLSSLGVLSLTVALLPCCSGSSDGGTGTPVSPVPESSLRIAGGSTAGGEGEALAAELWVSTGGALARPSRARFTMPSGALAAELRRRAEHHVEAAALAVGGPDLAGSARIRRLAADAGAPVDANGNGTNLDETVVQDQAQLAALAGGAAPAATRPVLFPFAAGLADFSAPLDGAGRGDYASQQTTGIALDDVSVEQLGHALRARVMVGAKLASDRRGTEFGATPERGALGLLLLQQAAALEETLLRRLFHNGSVLGRVQDPETYDPAVSPLWLPRAFDFAGDSAIPAAPSDYFPVDQAASLSGLAAVLRGASELAWLASEANPDAELRALFVDGPLGAAAAPGGPPVSSGSPPNWEEDIREIMHDRGQCLGCHLTGPGQRAGFDVTTYESTLAGGNNRVAWPSVVPGDHANSLLWLVLLGSTPVTRVRMPTPPRPPMDQADIDLVAEWIDAGALKEPQVEQPSVGFDLSSVLARNLIGLHQDASGALHDRHEGDAPSGFAAAHSTGAALTALASYVGANPDDAAALGALDRAADYALATLSDADGGVRAAVEIATGEALGAANLFGHARLTAGLAAAGRTLGRPEVQQRSRVAMLRMLADFHDPATGLFRSERDRQGTRYTPLIVAAVVEALREVAIDGPIIDEREGEGRRIDAAGKHDDFLAALRGVLVFSEWDGAGEVLNDGIPDTDGNGIPEPALAGGAHGRAPMFVGEILDGPSPEAEVPTDPITWSEHIQPLLRLKCAQCHMNGAARGDYRVDTPDLLREPGESDGALPLIVPGDPDASFFYRKVVDRNPSIGAQMPEALPPISPAAKQLIYRWILEGATSR